MGAHDADDLPERRGADQGNGPYSTPLIVGDRLFTTGVAGRLQCLDKKTGKVLWTQELWRSTAARADVRLRVEPDRVSRPRHRAGRRPRQGGDGVQQADGSVAWSQNDFGNVYSSPLLINVDGLEQLAVLMDGAVIAVNPHNGDLQWQVPFKADYSIAVATPVWGPDNLLFVSAEYNAGAKVIELQRKRSADDGEGAVELESAAAASRQRDAHRRHDLLLERRQGQPGDPERGRRAERQDSLAGAQHREGHVRLGGSEADHARPGRQPDDRASVAAGLQDRREGAAALSVCRGRRRSSSAPGSTSAIAAG